MGRKSNVAKNLDELAMCACGCGDSMPRYDGRGRERKYLRGHHAKLQDNKRVEVACENCGAAVMRPQWHLKKVKRHFCGHTCEGAYSARTGRRSGTNNGHYNTVTVPCAACGQDVSKAASLVNRRNRRVYCSECVGFVRRGRKGFYVGYPPEFSASLRHQIRKRDGFRCRLCDAEQKEAGTLHVHHIDYDKHNNDRSNLVSLCRVCHGKTNYGTEVWREHFRALLAG